MICICVLQSDQNSTEVHPSSTNTSVHTIKAEKWIFAVYFVYEDGSSTEMVFSECQFQSLNQGKTLSCKNL